MRIKIKSYLRINEPRCTLSNEIIKDKKSWMNVINQKIMNEYEKAKETIERKKKEKGVIYLDDVEDALYHFNELGARPIKN